MAQAIRTRNIAERQARRKARPAAIRKAVDAVLGILLMAAVLSSFYLLPTLVKHQPTSTVPAESQK